MSECAVKGYDEENKKGAIRHIVAREIGGKYIITLVTAKRDLPNLPYLVGMLSEVFRQFSLYINIFYTITNSYYTTSFLLLEQKIGENSMFFTDFCYFNISFIPFYPDILPGRCPDP
jgi:tRNA/tmRNA/rRNA uracil-C5-methylase (TrmA/RlmC/RlmD family)